MEKKKGVTQAKQAGAAFPCKASLHCQGERAPRGLHTHTHTRVRGERHGWFFFFRLAKVKTNNTRSSPHNGEGRPRLKPEKAGQSIKCVWMAMGAV